MGKQREENGDRERQNENRASLPRVGVGSLLCSVIWSVFMGLLLSQIISPWPVKVPLDKMSGFQDNFRTHLYHRIAKIKCEDIFIYYHHSNSPLSNGRDLEKRYEDTLNSHCSSKMSIYIFFLLIMALETLSFKGILCSVLL